MKVPASLLDWPAHASRRASLFVPLLLGAGIGTELARIAMSLVIGSHPPPLPPPPDDAPASTANLKLVGTLTGSDPATGLALIADDGKASVLKIGESLTGVSLRYVYADHVILDRAGTLERLSLQRVPHRSSP
jgi:type II secretory pathway component PulC